MFIVGFRVEQFEFHHLQRSNGGSECEIEFSAVAVDHALEIGSKRGDLFGVGHNSEEPQQDGDGDGDKPS